MACARGRSCESVVGPTRGKHVWVNGHSQAHGSWMMALVLTRFLGRALPTRFCRCHGAAACAIL
eukprot:5997747-Prymnesium_polylepis.1